MNERSFDNWITVQLAAVLSHRGLVHPVFSALPMYCKNVMFLREVLRQLYHVVLSFPFNIAGAIAVSDDEDLLDALARNLYAEVGGDTGERHIDMYRRLLRAVEVSTHRPIAEQIWRETAEIEGCCRYYYRNSNMGQKLGALFAFEVMSSPMVAQWDLALRSVSWLRPRDFEFFTIHIDIEAEHADDIALCCKKYWMEQAFGNGFAEARDAVMKGMERFWDRTEKLGCDLITSLSSPVET